MDKQVYGTMFEEKQQQFTREEIAIFKRYIEENVAYSDNNFEFLEENLSYYSYRHTSNNYFSPAEYFHVNSNLVKSDEMIKNIHLYERAIEWHSSTVHPEDSEYVQKKEKYIDVDVFPERIKHLVSYLNTFSNLDYFSVDILIYSDGAIYQYLPQKRFLFKWKNHAMDFFNKLQEQHYFVLTKDIKEKLSDENGALVIFPIFTPIRKMLFLGEYGYRSSLMKYGMIVERIRALLDREEVVFNKLDYFETAEMNNFLGLDGVERSVLTLYVVK
ncbi:hypothetical protein ACERII_00140 [Evansella sp. AB-rgal1]|uniref:hypothetical protein n=1 Tax=Evansella sp. AB-rgal1 TaxID=3242696 RepID=UPI00359CED10